MGERVIWFDGDKITISNIPISVDMITNFLESQLAFVNERTGIAQKWVGEEAVIKRSTDNWTTHYTFTDDDIFNVLDPNRPVYLAYNGWTSIKMDNKPLLDFLRIFGMIDPTNTWIGKKAIIFQTLPDDVKISEVRAPKWAIK